MDSGKEYAAHTPLPVELGPRAILPVFIILAANCGTPYLKCRAIQPGIFLSILPVAMPVQGRESLSILTKIFRKTGIMLKEQCRKKVC